MDMTQIGTFLAMLRKENGLTQEELGEELGVSNKTVSRWETGMYLPPVEMLQLLSERYGVSINELLSGERLTAENYREKAEENIKSALSDGPFTVEERLDFFKKKWRKDNLFTMVCCFVVWLILLLVLRNQQVETYLVACVGSLMAISMYMVLHNRMMAYAEGRVFDKQPKARSIEWEQSVRQQRQDRWKPRGGFWLAVLVALGFFCVDIIAAVLIQDPVVLVLTDSLICVGFSVLILWMMVKFFNKGSWREILHTKHADAALVAGAGVILFVFLEVVVLLTKAPPEHWQRVSFSWQGLFADLIYKWSNSCFMELLLGVLLLEGYYQHGERIGKRRLAYSLLPGMIWAVMQMKHGSRSAIFSGLLGFMLAAIYLCSHNILVPILLYFVHHMIMGLMGYEMQVTMINMPVVLWAFALISVWTVVMLLRPSKSHPQRMEEVAAKRTEGA